MSGKLIASDRMAKRRLEKFHNQCKEKARSRKSWERNFIVNNKHIGQRAGDQNSSIRNSVRDEQIAAIIMQGKLDQSACDDGHPITIAIDGIFRDFTYVELLSAQGMRETVLDKVLFRVVLRDGRVKVTVVTVYKNDDKLNEDIPEVDSNVW